MSCTKSLLLIAFLLISFFSFGQERNTPFNTTNNFISYRFGLAYPFFSAKHRHSPYGSSGSYHFSAEGPNYGVLGGFGFGHYFGRKFSVDLSPFLIYSKFAETNFHYEQISNPQESLIRERNGNIHFSHLSFSIPLDFNFRLKDNIEFTTGFFILKPVLDLEFTESREIDYTYHPAKMYSSTIKIYKNRRSFPRGGVHGQFSFLLKAKDWEQKRLNFEYYHSFSRANYQVYEHWIVVSFKHVFYE